MAQPFLVTTENSPVIDDKCTENREKLPADQLGMITRLKELLRSKMYEFGVFVILAEVGVLPGVCLEKGHYLYGFPEFLQRTTSVTCQCENNSVLVPVSRRIRFHLHGFKAVRAFAVFPRPAYA